MFAQILRFFKRQDDDNEDETNRLMFGVSQYDQTPSEENPLGDLLAGSDNFFPSDPDDGDNLGPSGKFQGNTLLLITNT